MDLYEAEVKDILNELEVRYDHIIFMGIEDKEGGKHTRRWKGNYLGCMSMCGIVYMYIFKAYEATMGIISTKKSLGDKS